MSHLTLIGAGGHGKVVADVAQACGFEDLVFIDQDWPNRKQNGRWPIIGTTENMAKGKSFCTIGQNAIREKVFQEFCQDDSPVLVHPSAVVSPSASLGAGTVVVAGVIVNADAIVGRGVILNTGSSVDHDCTIADFAHISPGARLAGGVRVGARSWIGIGAVVKEGISIGKDVVVAAGAAVISDVKDGVRIGGVPARKL